MKTGFAIAQDSPDFLRAPALSASLRIGFIYRKPERRSHDVKDIVLLLYAVKQMRHRSSGINGDILTAMRFHLERDQRLLMKSLKLSFFL